MTKTISDPELVASAKRGEKGALGEIYSRYCDAIYSYSLRLLKSEAEALDAVQETFCRMHEAVARLQNGAALRPWLFAIARHYAINHLRDHQKTEPLDPEALPDADTPFEIYLRKERSNTLSALIDNLKPAFREVILLREYAGLSYEEISIVTGESVSAIRSRLYKARRALAGSLPEEWKKGSLP
jgi:RNA polymerase sigma-70 factor (ECF subfamily)